MGISADRSGAAAPSTNSSGPKKAIADAGVVNNGNQSHSPIEGLTPLTEEQKLQQAVAAQQSADQDGEIARDLDSRRGELISRSRKNSESIADRASSIRAGRERFNPFMYGQPGQGAQQKPGGFNIPGGGGGGGGDREPYTPPTQPGTPPPNPWNNPNPSGGKMPARIAQGTEIGRNFIANKPQGSSAKGYMLSDSQFKAFVENQGVEDKAKAPTVVLVGRDACPNCDKIAGTLNQIYGQSQGRFNLVKLNGDSTKIGKALGQRFPGSMLPVVAVFDENGKLMGGNGNQNLTEVVGLVGAAVRKNNARIKALVKPEETKPNEKPKPSDQPKPNEAAKKPELTEAGPSAQDHKRLDFIDDNREALVSKFGEDKVSHLEKSLKAGSVIDSKEITEQIDSAINNNELKDFSKDYAAPLSKLIGDENISAVNHYLQNDPLNMPEELNSSLDQIMLYKAEHEANSNKIGAGAIFDVENPSAATQAVQNLQSEHGCLNGDCYSNEQLEPLGYERTLFVEDAKQDFIETVVQSGNGELDYLHGPPEDGKDPTTRHEINETEQSELEQLSIQEIFDQAAEEI